MCGRTCLTLSHEELSNVCKYKTKSHSDYVMPEWRIESNCGVYQPSYNIAPTDITPVLLSSAHFGVKEHGLQSERSIVPMMWGMIPFWNKGDRHHGYSTHNCRLENLLKSKLYRGPFERGQRCVILCEGYYEWQTTKVTQPSERAVFMVYMPQQADVKIYDRTSWRDNNVNLMKMAGLFDVCNNENGERVYSYSLITLTSSKDMSFLHHRMPVILETEQQINDWLDYENVKGKEALKLLFPAKAMHYYRVSNFVNNSRHKTEQCNKPFNEITPPAKPQKNKLMAAWLNSSTSGNNALQSCKRSKVDDNNDEKPKRLKSD